MSDAMSAPHDGRLHFEYWSDPYCIWAYVAQDKLEGLLSAHGERLAVEYRVIPVLGSIPYRFREGNWASAGIEGRVSATAKVAAAHGHPEVDGSCWRTVQPASSWAAGAAIQVIFAEERAGRVPVGAGARFQVEMRRAFFVHHQDTSQRKVQLALAERLGLPVSALEAGLDSGIGLALMAEDDDRRQKEKLQGSPTWVFDGGRAMLYGNVNTEVLRHTVETLVAGLNPGGSGC